MDLTFNQAAEDFAANAGGRAVLPDALAHALANPVEPRLVLPDVPVFHNAERAAKLAELLIETLATVKDDRRYLEELWRKLDELEAQAENVGSGVYRAFCELTRWCELELDQFEYRRQSELDARTIRQTEMGR